MLPGGRACHAKGREDDGRECVPQVPTAFLHTIALHFGLAAIGAMLSLLQVQPRTLPLSPPLRRVCRGHHARCRRHAHTVHARALTRARSLTAARQVHSVLARFLLRWLHRVRDSFLSGVMLVPLLLLAILVFPHNCHSRLIFQTSPYFFSDSRKGRAACAPSATRLGDGGNGVTTGFHGCAAHVLGSQVWFPLSCSSYSSPASSSTRRSGFLATPRWSRLVFSAADTVSIIVRSPYFYQGSCAFGRAGLLGYGG